MINGFLRNIQNFIYLLKKYKNHLFSDLGQLGTRIVECLKNDKVNKHVLVFNITKDKSDFYQSQGRNSTLKIVQFDLNSIRNHAMLFAVLRVVLFKVHFLICFDHNNFAMDHAGMNALYNGSLRIKISYSIPRNQTVYKWCGTKVAHCTSQGTSA